MRSLIRSGFVIALFVLAKGANAASAVGYEDLMVGSPAAADRQVTHANCWTPPYNVWTFKHVETILPTTTVDRGDGAVSRFETASVDLSDFEFVDFAGKTRNFEQFLADQHIDALLLWSDGVLRQEIYRRGQTDRTRHIMFSVTKSFTGLIAEMLIAERRLDEAKRVSHYLPEVVGSAYEDTTVRNVMDMEVGVEFTEIYDDPQSSIFQFSYAAGFRPVPPGVTASSSLYDYLPTLRKAGEHGRDFHYVTANSEVLGWVIERVTGMGFARAFEERLYGRIGAERDAFYLTDPHGKAVAGGGLAITARDALRLGVMMAQEGRFNGQQIASADVVRRIAAGGTPRPGLWGNEQGGRDHSYKSQWYIHHPTGTVSAAGIHGQTIHILPEEDVVMVVQSSYPEADGAFFGVTDAFFAAVAAKLHEPESIGSEASAAH